MALITDNQNTAQPPTMSLDATQYLQVESPFVESPFVESPTVGMPLAPVEEQEAPAEDPRLIDELLGRRRQERMVSEDKAAFFSQFFSGGIGGIEGLKQLSTVSKGFAKVADRYTARMQKKYLQDTHDFTDNMADAFMDWYATAGASFDWSIIDQPEGMVTIQDVSTYSPEELKTVLADRSAALDTSGIDTSSFATAGFTGALVGSNVFGPTGIVSLGDPTANVINSVVGDAAVNNIASNITYTPVPTLDPQAHFNQLAYDYNTQTSKALATTLKQVGSVAASIVSIDAFLNNPSPITAASTAASVSSAAGAFGSAAGAAAAQFLGPVAVVFALSTFLTKKPRPPMGHAIVDYADGKFQMVSMDTKHKGDLYVGREAGAAAGMLNEMITNYGFKFDSDKWQAVNKRVDMDKGRFKATAGDIIRQALGTGAISPTAATPKDFDLEGLFDKARIYGSFLQGVSSYQNVKLIYMHSVKCTTTWALLMKTYPKLITAM